MTNLEDLKLRVREELPHSIELLKSICNIPSISTQNNKITEMVQQLTTILESSGARVEILDNLGGNPIIYAHFTATTSKTTQKTLLFYNHYDVQPPEPLNEWLSPPFQVTERNEMLFARGIADNKGDLMARITAVKLLRESGLPCDVKFLIEGEEEIGSPNLLKYIEHYKELFTADACIWEHADKDSGERLMLMTGVKGMAYFELSCVGADVDLHSKVGAYIENPAWRLVNALSSMKNQNEIFVDGFFQDIIPPTDSEKEAVQNMPFNADSVKDSLGLRHPLITERFNKDPREAMIFDPTMTICGIESGYHGEGAKTVLPNKAIAKLDCRLVPNQDPEFILECLQKHLQKNGYNDIEIKLLNGQKAYRSDINHPFVQQVVQTAKAVYGDKLILVPNNSGTGPMFDIGNTLKIPIVSTGVGWANSNLHAPNESIRTKDYEQGILHISLLIEQFSRGN
jgi:acetylornithine deacetylase/succinyl-diaminopimelate desuccinylase-like protein